MSTDHTNGSPLDAGPESAVDPHFATPIFADSNGGVESSIPEQDASSDVKPVAPTGFGGSGPEGPQTDAIEFRVIRPGAPIRRLRLTGNRYTFGSAEGCSIRLSDHALRPMHAVLIRDASRILVRAYSVPIQVNGTRMTEATLESGDVLRLGAYQFELLSSTKASASPLGPRFETAPRSVFDSPVTEPSGRFGRAAMGGRKSLGGERSELPSSEDVIWRERLRREIDQWRERQSECDRREDRCDERESDLRSRETELWSRAENLYRRESRLQSQEAAAFQLYDEFAQRQEELIRLREETQSRQEQFRQRENEFRNEEFEYRRRLEEATRQLHQSQQQADSATEAVSRMREQFESLNKQIEVLSSQQEDIEQREQQQREEHERLRLELEKSRDEAIDAQAESEARRTEALSRVEEMSAQIEALKSGQGVDEQQQQAALEESQRVAQELRQQVEELHQSVSEAGEESSRLRHDYEEACESVRQLESLVQQSSQRGEQDRESWTAEADELRTAMEQLSTELANANSELADLREANADLSARLDTMQHERDEAQQELTSRPTTEAFDSLRSELDGANVKLDQMKRDYEDALANLDQHESPGDSLALAAGTPSVAGPPDQSDTEAYSGAEESSGAEECSGAEATESEELSSVAAGEPDCGDSSAATAADDDSPWPGDESTNDHVVDQEQSADGDWGTDSPREGRSDPAANVEQTAAWDSAQVESHDENDAPELGDPSAESDGISPWDADASAAENPPATDDTPAGTGFWNDHSTEDASEPASESSPESAWAGDSDVKGETDDVWGDASAAESDSPWSDTGESVESESQGWDTPESTYETTEEFGDGAFQPGAGGFENDGGSHAEDTFKSTDPAYRDTDEALPQHDAGLPSSEGDLQDESSFAGDESAHDLSDAAAPPENHFGEEPGDDAGEPLGDASPGDDSVVEGSLASMLIQDLETESADEAAIDTPPDGTFVMDDAPQSPGLDEQEPVSWDQEHSEESYTSQWSNNPDGYRVEEVRESSPYETTDETNTESEGSYAADGDGVGGYESSENESGPFASAEHGSAEQEAGQYAPGDYEAGAYESGEYDSADYESGDYDSADESGDYDSVAGGYETAGDESVDSDSTASYQPEAHQEPAQVDPPVSEPAPNDDSIEAYMNRLLQRCQGESSEDGDPTESVSISTTSEPSVLTSVETEVHAEPYEETEEEAVDPEAPLVPRSQAPEKNSDLSAMRKLANESARSAISRSVRMQTRDTQIRGAVNVGCAAGALLCGIACYFFIPGNIRWLAVAMTVIVAAISLKEGLSMFAQAKKRLASNNEADEVNEAQEPTDSVSEVDPVSEKS